MPDVTHIPGLAMWFQPQELKLLEPCERLTDKVLVLKPEKLRKSHRRKENLLWSVVTSSGLRGPEMPGPGRMVTVCLGDGELATWYQSDFAAIYLGAVPPVEILPSVNREVPLSDEQQATLCRIMVQQMPGPATALRLAIAENPGASTWDPSRVHEFVLRLEELVKNYREVLDS